MSSSKNYDVIPDHASNEQDFVYGIQRSRLQPSLAREYPLDGIPHGFYGSMMNCLGGIVGFLGSFPCVCLPNPYKRVKQGSVGLVSRFGKFYKVADPGLVKINPLTEHMTAVYITIEITDIPKQEVMTKDNVSIAIESVLYWHIVDPYKAVFGVQNVNLALSERASTVLRDVCGRHSLQDLIENRNAISTEIQEKIGPIAQEWGVQIEATLVKDIQFSEELQRSLSSAAQAKRMGDSRVIASQAEVEAARLMRDAAEILNTPAAMQIRYLETLSNMARAGQGPKTIFVPLPSSGGPTSTGALLDTQ